MDALASTSSGKGRAKLLEWCQAHPKWTLTLALLLALGPFLGKPFNMDDPLFIWAARQIHSHPWDPYGFAVNWYGTTSPMWEVMQNPPLAAYYLAWAASVAGWSEFALHGAMLLPALAVVLGTYRLARGFCERPMLAALVTLAAPVFLVSSSTVMCDVLMLAFWVWAVALWVEGIEQDSPGTLAAAGLMLALAAVTKYFGACLIPLLALYAAMRKRPLRRWAGWLLIPLFALGAWQWVARLLYGHEFLFTAAGYAGHLSGFLGGAQITAGLTALAFSGGGLAAVAFLAPSLWRGRELLMAIGGAALLAFALYDKYKWIEDRTRLSMEAQTIFWAAGGFLVLALAVADVRNRRDANSWLLCLWVVGTFAFAAVCNWTINGRSILPMTPAIGILLARRLQQQAVPCRRMVIPVAASALLALLVARSDFLLASAARESAVQTYDRFGRGKQTLWFRGHWGFQYYLAELGGRSFDSQQSVPRPGDFLAVPLNNTNQRYPNSPHERVRAGGPRYLAAMNLYVGAGFYTSQGGPLPFAFGDVPPEDVMVFK